MFEHLPTYIYKIFRIIFLVMIITFMIGIVLNISMIISFAFGLLISIISNYMILIFSYKTAYGIINNKVAIYKDYLKRYILYAASIYFVIKISNIFYKDYILYNLILFIIGLLSINIIIFIASNKLGE